MNEPCALRRPARAFEAGDRQWVLVAAPEDGDEVQGAPVDAVPVGPAALRAG